MSVNTIKPSAQAGNLSLKAEVDALLVELRVEPVSYTGGTLVAKTPITGETVAHVREVDAAGATSTIEKAHAAFLEWRLIPSPKRGELVRLLGKELRSNKRALGRLVSIEAGKIRVRRSRRSAGDDRHLRLRRGAFSPALRFDDRHRTPRAPHGGDLASARRRGYHLGVQFSGRGLVMECRAGTGLRQQRRLEAVGETPLTALAADALFARALRRFKADGGSAPDGLSAVLVGGREIGEALVNNPRVPLVSATGSTAMGRAVAPKLAQRFARAILELGGNNAAVVTPTADLDLTLRGVAFAAMGTAGQRCTTLRRLFVHESIYDSFMPRLKKVYASVSVGNPLAGNLVGPLIDGRAYEAMQRAIGEAKAAGAAIVGGDRVTVAGAHAAFYVRPALVEIDGQTGPVERETFAPILYVIKYSDFDAVIQLHNAVPQGLSSSIFTNDLREAEAFLSARGSDCGIANVNIGPSGAEIGGAFGGEKETGGGRESGSDAWKAYMRRATNTINYGRTLPLAQGVRFDVD